MPKTSIQFQHGITTDWALMANTEIVVQVFIFDRSEDSLRVGVPSGFPFFVTSDEQIRFQGEKQSFVMQNGNVIISAEESTMDILSQYFYSGARVHKNFMLIDILMLERFFGEVRQSTGQEKVKSTERLLIEYRLKTNTSKKVFAWRVPQVEGQMGIPVPIEFAIRENPSRKDCLALLTDNEDKEGKCIRYYSLSESDVVLLSADDWMSAVKPKYVFTVTDRIHVLQQSTFDLHFIPASEVHASERVDKDNKALQEAIKTLNSAGYAIIPPKSNLDNRLLWPIVDRLREAGFQIFGKKEQKRNLERKKKEHATIHAAGFEEGYSVGFDHGSAQLFDEGYRLGVKHGKEIESLRKGDFESEENIRAEASYHYQQRDRSSILLEAESRLDSTTKWSDTVEPADTARSESVHLANGDSTAERDEDEKENVETSDSSGEVQM